MNKTAQAIEQRRRAEEAYSQMEQSLAHEKRSRDIANFEVVTAKKIEKRTKQERFERLMRDNEIRLLERRKQLAELYNYEISEWKNEMAQLAETQEDRKARIMERAYALRDAREAARQKIVEEAYNLRWRDSCDDARTLDSKAVELFMNEERLRQIEEKKKRKQELSENENAWLKEWSVQLSEMNARDKAKSDFKNMKRLEMVDGLKSQINFNSSRKRNEFLQTKKEDDEEIENIRKALAEERQLQLDRQLAAKEAGKAVLRFNAQAKAIAAEEGKRTAVEDALLLNYALKNEAQQIAAEEAKKKGARQAAAVYKKYLEEQMLKEAANDAEVDAIRKAEEEKVWKAR